MPNRAKFLLISLAFLLNPTNQQQNLCGTDGRRILVADPSSCHKYLLCRWDFSSNPPRLMSVHQNDCRDFGSNHFQTSSDGTTGICVTNNSICSDPIGLCPPASQHDIMVANPVDRNCRQYRLCRQPDFPYLTCRTPLVFNRNSGICDFDDFAPCSSFFVECQPGETGNFPGHRCYSYIFCFEGNQYGDVFECPNGWWFNKNIGDCEEDIHGVCARVMKQQIIKLESFF